MALLQRGSTFGGGAAVIGEGGLQARLRVVAGSDVECYILPLGALLARGTPEMLRCCDVQPPLGCSYVFPLLVLRVQLVVWQARDA